MGSPVGPPVHASSCPCMGRLLWPGPWAGSYGPAHGPAPWAWRMDRLQWPGPWAGSYGPSHGLAPWAQPMGRLRGPGPWAGPRAGLCFMPLHLGRPELTRRAHMAASILYLILKDPWVFVGLAIPPLYLYLPEPVISGIACSQYFRYTALPSSFLLIPLHISWDTSSYLFIPLTWLRA